MMALRAKAGLAACDACPLRRKPLFRPLRPEELGFVARMRHGEITLGPRRFVVRPQERSTELYTVREGWAAQFSDIGGTRQLVKLLLPGDLVGLRSLLTGSLTSSVETLTPVRLCVLDGALHLRVFREHPELALDLLRTAHLEEERAEQRARLLGRASALERIGYFLLDTYERLAQREAADATQCAFPLRRADIASLTGLSDVHVSRTLAELRRRGLASVGAHTLSIPDRQRLIEAVGVAPPPAQVPHAIL
jgi:CRP/FNR family transcriptional regulator, anaerobic regulatory protein